HSYLFFFFSSRRRHTRSKRDWSSDVCSSDLFTWIKTKCLQSHNNIIFIVSNLINPWFTEQFMFIDLFWVKRFFVARWSHFHSECLVPSYNHVSKNINNCNNKPNFFKQMHVKDHLKLYIYRNRIIMRLK